MTLVLPLLTIATIAVFAPAVQPDLVGQVGRAERLVALAVGAVAGRADRELGAAELGRDGCRAGCPTGSARSSRRCARPRPLPTAAAIGGICPTRPLRDRLPDRLGRAAPQPVVVGQVREALAAARVRAVAGGAVVDEQALADAPCACASRASASVVHRREACVERRHRRRACGLLGLVLAAGCSSPDARRRCPAPGRARGRRRRTPPSARTGPSTSAAAGCSVRAGLRPRHGRWCCRRPHRWRRGDARRRTAAPGRRPGRARWRRRRRSTSRSR